MLFFVSLAGSIDHDGCALAPERRARDAAAEGGGGGSGNDSDSDSDSGPRAGTCDLNILILTSSGPRKICTQ